MKDKKTLCLNIHYAFIQGFHWIMMASLVYAVSVFRERGLAEDKIGICLAVAPLVSIVVQPAVATLADRIVDKIPLKYIASILLVFSILGNFIWIYAERSNILSLMVFAIFGATIYSISPLYSSMAIQFSENGHSINFSVGRGIGSLLYAVASVLFGWVIDEFGIDALLFINILILAATFLIVISFETFHGGRRVETQRKPHGIWYIMKKNKMFVYFLIASFLLFAGNSMTLSFLIDVVKKLGGGNTELGYCQFVLAISELPIAFLFMKVKNKVGIRRILQISSVFMILKMANILLAPTLNMLILGHLFQSFGNGAYWAASVYYVEEVISPEDRVKGQSLMYIASSGLSGALANVVSGYIVNHYDVQILVTIGIVVGLTGMVCMQYAMHEEKEHAVMRKNRRYENG